MFYRVPDSSGDASYDFFIQDTTDSPRDEVERDVMQAIETVKTANPDEYTWDEVMDLLRPKGYVNIYPVTLFTEF